MGNDTAEFVELRNFPGASNQLGPPDAIVRFDATNRVLIDAFVYEGEMRSVTLDGVTLDLSALGRSSIDLPGDVSDPGDPGSLCRQPDGIGTFRLCDSTTPVGQNLPN